MKSSTVRTALLGAGAFFLFAALGVQAQMPGAGAPAGMNAAMVKLFGDIKAFTAKADVQVLDNSQKELAAMPMEFAFLDNKIRVEIDMSLAKSASMPPGAGAQLKQMGMAQIVSIVRPDKNLVYVMYPEQKVLMSMPLSKESSAAPEKEAKLQKTELGKEKIDGHACVKNKVVISDDKGQSVEATTWNAGDLKDFPVQIQTKEKENTSIVRFKQVQFAKPEAGQFEPPAGYTQYKDPQEMMQALMSKMMQGTQK